MRERCGRLTVFNVLLAYRDHFGADLARARLFSIRNQLLQDIDQPHCPSLVYACSVVGTPFCLITN
jgi:hypothetical protein